MARNPVTTNSGTPLDAIEENGVYTVSGLARGIKSDGTVGDFAISDTGGIATSAPSVSVAQNDGVRKDVNSTSSTIVPARSRSYVMFANIEGPDTIFVRPGTSAASATQGVPLPVGAVWEPPMSSGRWTGAFQAFAATASKLLVVEW